MSMDTNTFDTEEMLVKSALSGIQVDPSGIKEGVMKTISEQKMRSARRIRKAIQLAAAVVAVLAISTTALAATGGFDWIMQRINPTFAEVIEPVMLYTEDEGIRMTVIGAQTFDNMAVVYVSLQDISGENRLTEMGSLGLGLFLMEAIDEYAQISAGDESLDLYEGVIMPPTFSMGMGVRRVYFDETTSTAYFELTMTSDRPITNSLIINNTCVELDRIFIDAKPIGIDLADLAMPSVIETIPGYDVHSSRGWNDSGLFGNTIKMLQPDRFAELPNYTKDHWISNVGVIDGRLHVQTTSDFTGSRFGGSGVSFALLRSDGELIHSDDMIFATVDENFNLTSNMTESADGYTRSPLQVSEFIFEVDVDSLANYTLVFFGSISTGVEGDWTIQVDTGETATQLLTITDEHYVVGHTIEFITINPLGMQVRGSFPAHWTMGGHETLSAQIETDGGIIELRQSGGFYTPIFESRYDTEPVGGNFAANFDAESLIVIDTVTAVILNGVRIALE